MKLTELAPQKVFAIFEQICAIPHGSGDTARLAEFCKAYAAARGVSATVDEVGNVVMYVPASAGREQLPTVIVQGHLDMVCEKRAEKKIDFAADGLDVQTDGAWVWADGTTLGGDDGIAVAMGLALLDEPAPHPPLEIVLTVDEETGMYGAHGLRPECVKGRMLLNIDSEVEGVLTVGCAGGARMDMHIEMIPTALTAPCFRVAVKGLRGGHSGIEIGKGGANANAVLGRFLSEIDAPFGLVEIYGGEKDNAIAASAECVISTDADLTNLADRFVGRYRTAVDPDFCLEVTPTAREVVGYDSISSRVAATFLAELPQGVVTMSDDIEGLVQTSLNFGTLRLQNDELCATFSVRSSVGAEKERLTMRLAAICAKHGGYSHISGEYPAWEYRAESPLRQTMTAVYERLFGTAPATEIIHAGLECGILSDKLTGLDAVSFGPNIMDIHTPDERLEVASVERTYRYLLAVLEEIK